MMLRKLREFCSPFFDVGRLKEIVTLEASYAAPVEEPVSGCNTICSILTFNIIFSCITSCKYTCSITSFYLHGKLVVEHVVSSCHAEDVGDSTVQQIPHDYSSVARSCKLCSSCLLQPVFYCDSNRATVSLRVQRATGLLVATPDCSDSLLSWPPAIF